MPLRLTPLLAALAFAACAGEVGGVATDYESAESTRRDSRTRDAGKGRDAGRDVRVDAAKDQRASENDEDDEEAGDDELTEGTATRSESEAPQVDAGLGDCPGGRARPLAAGLRIQELALYQTIKIPLYKDGAWVSARPAPVVQGKQALVRLFVEPTTGYARRAIKAVLTLKNGTESKEIVDERTLTTASTDAEVASTFSFAVDGALLGPDTTLSAALQELDCAATSAPTTDARLPAADAQALGATALGKLRVVVVPVSLNGRLPVTSEAEIAKMRAALLAYYPVPDVELTVRARAFTSNSALAGTDGNSWTNLLNQIVRERATDRPGSDVYYFGLVQPAASMAAYCGRGCIMGIAPQTVRVSPGQQVGLGASFANEQTYETLVHELGHAHGRGHAPCAQGGGISGVDSQFPDKSGAIGVWGWDNRTNTLMKPTSKDIMGYCAPNWISGYTYAALATRSQQVNLRAFFYAGDAATRWHHVLLYEDGSSRWGGSLEDSMPGGEPEPAAVLDASGRELAQIEVVRIPLSHSNDVFLYIPEPGPNWAAIALSDRVLTLSDIAPAQ